MKVYEIYFSPTGGTKKAADLLAASLGEQVTEINLTSSTEEFQPFALTEEDLAVIAVPSYGGRVPAVAMERLAQIRGNGAKGILVCVYGNRAYEDTLVELRDGAAQGGFQVIAAVAAVAEHSIARQFGAGRPDEEDRRQLAHFAGQIREKLSAGNTAEPEIPGNRPYKKMGKVGLTPKPTKECVRCGVCARECPVGAISREDPKQVDQDTCISCMRCVSVCPHDARRVSPLMLGAVGLALKKVCSERKDCQLFL